MANISLDKFIFNLEKLTKDPISVFEKTIYEIVYATFVEMAKYTITDSGEARRKVLEVAAKVTNKSISQFQEHAYDYWEQFFAEGRYWGNNLSDVSISENKGKKTYNLGVSIDDDGLYAQEYSSGGQFNGYNYPSENVVDETGFRDNSNYKTRHVTYVRDLVNNSDWNKLTELDYDKMVKDMTDYVEKFLFGS